MLKQICKLLIAHVVIGKAYLLDIYFHVLECIRECHRLLCRNCMIHQRIEVITEPVLNYYRRNRKCVVLLETLLSKLFLDVIAVFVVTAIEELGVFEKEL